SRQANDASIFACAYSAGRTIGSAPPQRIEQRTESARIIGANRLDIAAAGAGGGSLADRAEQQPRQRLDRLALDDAGLHRDVQRAGNLAAEIFFADVAANPRSPNSFRAAFITAACVPARRSACVAMRVP